MRISRIIIFIYSLITVGGTIDAQGVAINNIIATDITATPDDIIEIDFGDHLPNVPFVLAWIDSSGRQYALPFQTGTENLSIPIGTQKGWNGSIGLVGLSVNNVKATIRKADLSDVWASFLRVLPLSPGSINFSGTYFILGKPFRWICAGLMIVLIPIILLLKKKWEIALLVSFLVAWSAYDLRSGYNRWEILSGISEEEWHIPILKDLETFLPQARDIIGEDGTWTKERLSGFLNSYCKYELADLQYYPAKSEERKTVDYIITTQPKKRKVVLSEGPYYLVQLK